MNQVGEWNRLAHVDGLEGLATGVALLDAAGRFQRINPAFCEMIGTGSRRLLRQPIAALHAERLVEAVRRASMHTGTQRLDAVAVCVTPGRDCVLDFLIGAGPDGVVLEAWLSHNTASSRLSESLRGFAHEVKNPLAAISGAAQLLQLRARDARERDLAQLILSESGRLAALADKLLGTRSELATRAVNVHAMLERAAQMLGVERPDIAVVRDYDPSLPALQGDPDRLLQILLNLARNAVEANARRIVLRSRAEAGVRDANGRTIPALRIEIEDDGDGVPPEIETTLFEPMVSGRADGSGLGLALSREIAREHGGELSWRRRGDGSCFVLLLPRRLARVPARESSHP